MQPIRTITFVHPGMQSRTKFRLLFGYRAVLYAFGLLALRGTISIGVWHSVSASHRLQADAFLRGEPALSYDPSDFGHDLYWSRGGVNHGI
jgi:hypothetical protein